MARLVACGFHCERDDPLAARDSGRRGRFAATIAAIVVKTEAMQPVHWNAIAIPVGTWIAAGYFGKTELRAAR